ncbi:hypothetical protein, partial [uncultured Cohaesibacter sp.]|uniref:hypothetical protein n=1 Tax=uncultured Cohaesibacter sp. TaxID=1002546 RepID=UPI0029C75473
LRTLIGHEYIAKRQCRKLYLDWEPDNSCPGKFEDYFEPICKTVKRGSLLWKYLVDVRGAEVFSGQEPVQETLKKHNESFSNAEIDALFQKLKLKPHLQAKLDAMVQTSDFSSCVGLHIRRTDHVALAVKRTGGFSDDEQFTKRIDELISKNENQQFYLATDNTETQEKFLSLYGDRMIVSEPIKDSSAHRKTSLEHAIIDLFLLSRCRIILGSVWSSYSSVAANLSNGRAELIRLTSNEAP